MNTESREAVGRSGCPCRSGIGLRQAWRADLARCLVLSEVHQDGAGLLTTMRALLLYPGFYGVAAYRLSHATLHSALPVPLRWLAYLPVLLVHRVVIGLTKVEISARAHVGPGMFVNHAQGVVVGPVVAGSNLTVSHWASIGLGANAALDVRRGADQPIPAQRTAEGRCPRIGDRVWVGIGAVVGGSIDIGDDVMIGANTVVSREVPARAVVSGSPAQVTSGRGSFGFVHYRGMAHDEERAASLALVPARHEPDDAGQAPPAGAIRSASPRSAPGTTR